MDGQEIEEEGADVKARKLGKEPMKDDIEKHELTHIPFRNWCSDCVRGRAVNPGHYIQTNKEDEEVPVISIDYMYLKAREGDETIEEGQPILIMKDRKSKTITAHVVEHKGANENAIKRLGQDIGLLGYKKIILKSDEEPSIIALKQTVKRERSEQIILEESPVG